MQCRSRLQSVVQVFRARESLGGTDGGCAVKAPVQTQRLRAQKQQPCWAGPREPPNSTMSLTNHQRVTTVKARKKSFPPPFFPLRGMPSPHPLFTVQ